MGYNQWWMSFSRLRSTSRTIYSHLRRPNYTYTNTTQNDVVSELTNRFQWRFSSTNFIPISAAAAASLLFHLQPNTSFSESSRSSSIGGTGSTEFEVKGACKSVPQELIEDLKSICGENMTMDYDERFFHGKPQNSFHKAVNIPDIVLFPRSEHEVSLIVKSCNKHKVPIVPYGGATSIEGHTLSPHGGVCIDMSQMKRVKALHVKDMDVVVEPGIGWIELNEYLEPYGLFFPLDPGKVDVLHVLIELKKISQM